MSEKTTIADALAHSPQHAGLVAQRFAAANVKDAEFTHSYADGVHTFTAENGYSEEILAPEKPKPAAEKPEPAA